MGFRFYSLNKEGSIIVYAKFNFFLVTLTLLFSSALLSAAITMLSLINKGKEIFDT